MDKIPGRSFDMALVAFRVYRNTGKRLRWDERGTFDGLPSRYDEWLPVYSPQIAKHLTKSQGNFSASASEFDEELDNFIKPSEGFDRVYAVPRIEHCLSKKFLYQMDKFGNTGGFDQLLDVMENQELDDKGLTLTQIGYMITLISMPIKLWQKQFIEEYGHKFCSALEKRFLESDDQKIRDLDITCYQQAMIAFRQIKTRLSNIKEARKESQVFALKVIKKCLTSQYLEKRI